MATIKSLTRDAARYAELKALEAKVAEELEGLKASLKPAVEEAGGKLKVGKVLLTLRECNGRTTFDLKQACKDDDGFAARFARYIKTGAAYKALEYETLP